MNSTQSTALALCEAATKHPDMSNPTAKIAAWLVGVASRTGGFPVTITYRQIQSGVTIDGVLIEGTNCHNNTIRTSIEWLKDRGLITISEGPYSSGGHRTVVVSAV